MTTSLNELWNLRWIAYDFTFNELLERLSYRAKSDLKLNPSFNEYANAKKSSEENSPLFACTTVISGIGFMLIDDGSPGIGCFSTESQRSFTLPPYRTLNTNKMIAEELYRELEREYTRNYSDEYYEACEGDFCPEEILLLDQFKQSIAVYQNQQWLPALDLPSQDEWLSLLDEVDKLRDEARFEGGWDNHSTSRLLWKEADNIANRIKLAQRLSRIVQ